MIYPKGYPKGLALCEAVSFRTRRTSLLLPIAQCISLVRCINLLNRGLINTSSLRKWILKNR